MTVQAVCVDPQRVAEIWPTFRSFIQKAVSYGRSSFDDIEKDVLAGRGLLWLAWDGGEVLGVAVTQLVGDDCVITATAGKDVRKWIHLEEAIAEYARAEGKTHLYLIGRPGWRRLLPHYKQQCVTLERKL